MEPDGYISCGVRFAASGETLEGDFHVGLIVSQIRKKVIAHGASPFGPLHEPAFSVSISGCSLIASNREAWRLAEHDGENQILSRLPFSLRSSACAPKPSPADQECTDQDGGISCSPSYPQRAIRSSGLSPFATAQSRTSCATSSESPR